MKIIKYNKRKNLSLLPNAPGVYFLYGKNKNPIYIGKASSLRDRLKSHFKTPSFLLQKEIRNIKKIGYIEARSEIEALLLESRLIKKYQPKLNIIWKDDKKPFYVGITRESLPKIFITHQPSTIVKKSKTQNSKSKINSKSQNTKLKIFYIGPFTEGRSLKIALRLLRRIFPYYSKKHGKLLCLYCHLGLCPGPKPDPKEYRKNIEKLVTILEGKRKSVLKKLKKEMELAARLQEFEKAAKIRNQIQALENIFEHRIYQDNQTRWTDRTDLTFKTLKKCLGLEKPPKRIEAYDISNIQGKSAVGSMVVFIDNQPDKSQYRKFKIKTEGIPNDTAMLKEVLSRRFQHPEWQYPDLIFIDGGIAQLSAALKIKNQKSHAPKPRINTGQASFGTGQAKIKNMIKVISLAKKENRLYVENIKQPFLLKTLPKEISNLLLHLRDEAHRFAIQYHRKISRQRFIRN